MPARLAVDLPALRLAVMDAPGLLGVLAVLFFLSGTSALIYQVLWLRLLGLVFGVTVYAASTVWAVFMAGLAIGSFVGGRMADRSSRLLMARAASAASVVSVVLVVVGMPVSAPPTGI